MSLTWFSRVVLAISRSWNEREKNLNWMDPNDIVELEERHNVGFEMHICWKTMRTKSSENKPRRLQSQIILNACAAPKAKAPYYAAQRVRARRCTIKTFGLESDKKVTKGFQLAGTG